MYDISEEKFWNPAVTYFIGPSENNTAHLKYDLLRAKYDNPYF